MENNGREQWNPTILLQLGNLYVYLGIFSSLITKKPIPGRSDSREDHHSVFLQADHGTLLSTPGTSLTRTAARRSWISASTRIPSLKEDFFRVGGMRLSISR